MTRFYRAAWIFYLVLAVGGLVGLAARGERIALELFLAPARSLSDLALGLGAGLALVALWEGIRSFAPAARALESTLGALVGPLGAGEVAALALISAVGEEVAFRGALQSWLGLLPAAALFALLHVGPGPRFRWWTLFAAAGGLALGALVDATGVLAPAIVAHLVVNLVQLRRIATLGWTAADRARAGSDGGKSDEA
jgi:hypothetical protein